jgi:hypothetical protein
VVRVASGGAVRVVRERVRGGARVAGVLFPGVERDVPSDRGDEAGNAERGDGFAGNVFESDFDVGRFAGCGRERDLDRARDAAGLGGKGNAGRGGLDAPRSGRAEQFADARLAVREERFAGD